MITPHDQSNAQAYALARKVWPLVQSAATLRQASAVLQSAGCKLHYYCAVN